MKYDQFLFRLAQAWILVLVAGSLQPVRPGPIVAHVGLHRAAHWLAFTGAALLLLGSARNRRQEISRSIAFCGLGVLLEYAQHLIYRGSMEWWDVRDDTLAVLAALSICHFARRSTPTAAFAGLLPRKLKPLLEAILKPTK